MKVVTPLPQFQDSRINVDFDDSKSRFPASKLRQWRHLYGSNKSQNDGCDDTNGIEKLSIEIEREMMRNTNTIARDFWTLWILCQSQVRSSSAWCEGLGNLIKGNTTHVVGKGKAFENIDNFTWLGSHCDDSEQAISSICTATTHHLVNKGSGVAMKDRERDKKKRKDSEGIGKVNIRCAKGNKERKFATELKLNQNEMLQLLNK
eukprot:113490_1